MFETEETPLRVALAQRDFPARQIMRHRQVLASVLAGALACTLVACGSNTNDASATDGSGDSELAQYLGRDTISFAVSDLEGAEELQREFGVFQEELEETLELNVELFPVPSLNAAVAAMDAGDVDVMLTGPSEYVVLHAREIADTLIGIQRTGYHSIIYRCADGTADNLQDLIGQRVIMQIPGGTSSHLGPSKIFQDEGIDPLHDIDLELVMANGPAAEACASGDATARGSSVGSYENMIEETGVPREEVPIIAEGPDFPPDLFAVSQALPDEFVDRLKEVFLDNKDDILGSILSSGADENYYAGAYADATMVEISDSDYDYMREAFAAIGASELTRFPGS